MKSLNKYLVNENKIININEIIKYCNKKLNISKENYDYWEGRSENELIWKGRIKSYQDIIKFIKSGKETDEE